MTSCEPVPSFSASGADIISQQITTSSSSSHLTITTDSAFSDYFDISSTASFLTRHSISRLALQFPDSLLPFASRVVKQLTTTVNQVYFNQNTSLSLQCFILADTSFGACCVDDIAAQHFHAEAIVHYGNEACLSRTTRMPVYYVFGRKELDVEKFLQIFTRHISSSSSKRWVVFYDLHYQHCMQRLQDMMQQYSEDECRVVVATVEKERTVMNEEDEQRQNNVEQQQPIDNSALPLTNPSSSINQSSLQSSLTQHSINGFTFNLATKHSLTDYSILYITNTHTVDSSSSVSLINLMINYNANQFFTYAVDGSSIRSVASTSINRLLSRRYYLMNKVKNAQRIGIVVGTLAVVDYLKMLKLCQDLIEQSGKKSYTLVIGKLNEPKLCNYSGDCEIFVLLSCSLQALYNSDRSVGVDVVTPFELECALKGKQWNGSYSTEFASVLKDQNHVNEDDQRSESDDTEADDSLKDEELRGVRYDLITGKLQSALPTVYKSTLQSSKQRPLIETDNGQLLPVIDEFGQLSVRQVEGASEVLKHKRTFKGLEFATDHPNTPASIITGQTGIARQYDSETYTQH